MMGLRHGSAKIKTGTLADGLASYVGKVAFNLAPSQLFQFLKWYIPSEKIGQFF